MAGPGETEELAGRRPWRGTLGVFALLFLLTALEVGVSRPGLAIPRAPMVLCLVALALAKAGLVAFYFMHLKHEMRALRWMVLTPFALPVLYALLLISEA